MLSINQLAWVANVLVSTVSGGAVGGHRLVHGDITSPVTSLVGRGHHLPMWRGHPLSSGTTGLGTTASSLWASQSEGAGRVAGRIGHIAGKGHASLDFQALLIISFTFWDLCVTHGHLSHFLYIFGDAQVSITCVPCLRQRLGSCSVPGKLLEPPDPPLSSAAAVHSPALGFPTPPVPVTMLTS